MKNPISRFFTAATLVLCTWATTSVAEYPERPVTFILPWPAGDVDDQLLRVIAEEFTKETGVAAKVVNRAGGFGIEGAQNVANAAPDGYTVGSIIIDLQTSYVVQDILPFAADDLDVIGIYFNFPFVLAAAKDAPYSNLAELAEYAKINPVRFAHFGFETIPAQQTFEAARQLGFEFSTETGYDSTDCTTLANGNADVMNATTGWVLPCLDDLKIIAAYTENPISLIPDAPLLRDQIGGPTFALWNGLFVPKGTPQSVKDLLAKVTENAIKSERAVQIAENTGAEIYWMDESASRARIASNLADVTELFNSMSK
jgi:tripartite-type tricarboxylate transporter receptor subunit TctC